MTLGLTKVVQVGDRELVVHELSVPELRQWLLELRAAGLAASDVIREAIMDVPLPLLALMCRCGVDELPPYPSQLEQIQAAAQETNPRFFGLLSRLQAATGSASMTLTGA